LSKKKYTTRIKTRLTTTGWGYLLLMLVILLLGINYANNLIYALAYFLMSLLVVGYLQTRAQLKNLIFNNWHCQEVFVGNNINYQIQIKNNRIAKSWGLFAGLSDIATPHLFLSSNQAQNLILKNQAKKRGLYQHGSVYIFSTYPFGIFQASKLMPKLPECTIYPQAIGVLHLPDNSSGDSARQHQESESITSIRKYIAGDNLSRIGWKFLARSDVLMTKEFDGALGDPVLVLNWKQSEISNLGIEARLSQLCKWVIEADRLRFVYSLILPQQTIEANSGRPHRQECLESLAMFEVGTNV
jgi:uncharacterized protein (DUF58 family)